VIPVVESTRIVTQVSEGKVDELVTQALKGDHEKLKNGVNNIAVALQLMQKEMLRMSDLAKEDNSPNAPIRGSSRAPTPRSSKASIPLWTPS